MPLEYHRSKAVKQAHHSIACAAPRRFGQNQALFQAMADAVMADSRNADGFVSRHTAYSVVPWQRRTITPHIDLMVTHGAMKPAIKDGLDGWVLADFEEGNRLHCHNARRLSRGDRTCISRKPPPPMPNSADPDALPYALKEQKQENHVSSSNELSEETQETPDLGRRDLLKNAFEKGVADAAAGKRLEEDPPAHHPESHIQPQSELPAAPAKTLSEPSSPICARPITQCVSGATEKPRAVRDLPATPGWNHTTKASEGDVQDFLLAIGADGGEVHSLLQQAHKAFAGADVSQWELHHAAWATKHQDRRGAIRSRPAFALAVINEQRRRRMRDGGPPEIVVRLPRGVFAACHVMPAVSRDGSRTARNEETDWIDIAMVMPSLAS